MASKPTTVLTGHEALGDWTTDAPGVRRKITVDDLPRPFDTPSANNIPRLVKRPEGAMPRAPKGFQVSEFATGFSNPRKIVTAPNGDIFVAESMPGRIKLLRDADGDGKAETSRGLRHGTHAGRSGSPSIRPVPIRRTSTSATPTPSSGSPTRTATPRRGDRPR